MSAGENKAKTTNILCLIVCGLSGSCLICFLTITLVLVVDEMGENEQMQVYLTL